MLGRAWGGRSDWKVACAVLAVLLVGELMLYAVEPRLSLDVQHIRMIPAIVRDIETTQRPSVLFIGNSLTRHGIVPGLIRSAWSQHDLPRAKLSLIYPDSTTLSDWFYLYRRFVEPARSRPRVIVICFASNQLADSEPVQPERLGSQFAGLPFAAEAFSHDVLSLSDRVRYLLGAVSRVWADRERVQTRVLALIPGYEALAQALNQAAGARQAAPSSGEPARYARLARFIARVKQDGTDIVFVATPLPRRFPLPEALRRTIRDGGAELIDLQGTEPADPVDFLDGYHLSPVGAERFSLALGAATSGNASFRAALLRNRPVDPPTSTASRVRWEPAVH